MNADRPDYRKKKLNNKGFTLLEVLIALAILGIIVAPLLRLFVIGAQTNKKARQTMRATTSAENTMEELKAASLADLLRVANGATKNAKGQSITSTDILKASGGTAESVFEASLYGTTYSKVTGSSSSVNIQTDSTTGAQTSSEFVAKTGSSSDYYVILKKVSDSATSGSEVYDEVIHYNTTQSRNLSNANISSMTATDCGYYAQDSGEALLNAQTYEDSNTRFLGTEAGASSVARTADDFLSIMTKTITVDIAYDSGLEKTTATVSYTYDCGQGNTAPADRYLTYSEVIFDNTTSGEKLNSLFVYYYPFYNTGATARDSIVINNPTGRDVKVFLICMPDTSGNTSLASVYKANLELVETVDNTATDFSTRVCSNLADGSFIKDDHNTALILEVHDMGNTSEEQIFYNVTVTLYKHNDSSWFTDASGSTVTFTPSDSDKVTEFSSTILDNNSED